MRLVPDPFSLAWMDTLADNDLLNAEVRLRARFALLEQRELSIRGPTHPLMRGPDDLMEMWDRWTRLLFAMRGRSLLPRSYGDSNVSMPATARAPVVAPDLKVTVRAT